LSNRYLQWVLFIVLCLIWGSSFLLMKIGLQTLSAYEVAAIRILSAGIVLLPFAVKAFSKIPKEKWGIIIISGLLGSFFPAFLFCIAETKISSALTGMLNALTPLFTVIIGTVFFKAKTNIQKLIGIGIGLIGLYFLITPTGNLNIENLAFTSLVMLATIFYALNVNIVSKQITGLKPLDIAAIAFIFLIIPSISILAFQGFFGRNLGQTSTLQSVLAACVLGIIGTAFASVLFYQLVKIAGALFASTVTYGIPFIAVVWGIMYGEKVTLLQMICLSIILIGVYIVNRSNKKSN